MTVDGVLLCTEESQTERLAPLPYSFQPATKQSGFGQKVVLNSSVSVTGAIFGACAQLGPQEDVRDFLGTQCEMQALAIELWIHATIGGGSHVSHRTYRVLPEETEQLFNRMVRVTNGIDAGHGFSPALSGVRTPATSL